jgi:hypothetical protein
VLGQATSTSSALGEGRKRDAVQKKGKKIIFYVNKWVTWGSYM